MAAAALIVLPAALADQYARRSAPLLERIERIYEEVAPVARIRVHGDCHLGNLPWAEQGPRFVDLDDCAMGPRIQDLWMLLSGEPAEQQAQWAELIGGYEQFADLEYRELQKLKSTYVDTLPATVNPATGRIHTSFNQAGAANGRSSSSDPHLRNIPGRQPRGGTIPGGFGPP